MENLEKWLGKWPFQEAEIFENKEKLAQNISTALVFGQATRVLSKEDIEKIIWLKFWIQRYGEYAEPNYCEIQWINYGSFEVKYSHPERPSIRCDQEELASILREQWCTLIREWRSWFASRNSYIIKKDEEKTEKISTPLIMIVPLNITDEEKTELWIEWSSTTENKYIVWTWSSYTWEILMRSEINEMDETLQKAREELVQRRAKKMQEYIQSNKQGDIAVITVWWWPEDFSYSDIPENYTIISERRIACTADHRRNMSHTYQVVLLDKNIFAGKSYAKIQVPDEYKGIVIGKWWSTIKNLCEKLNCRIMIW